MASMGGMQTHVAVRNTFLELEGDDDGNVGAYAPYRVCDGFGRRTFRSHIFSDRPSLFRRALISACGTSAHGRQRRHLTGGPVRKANLYWYRQVGEALRYDCDMESSTRCSNEVSTTLSAFAFALPHL